MKHLLLGGFVVALAACGSKSDDGAAEHAAEQPTPTEAPPSPAEKPAENTPPPPPAADTGAVTWAGETTELSGDDFMICETVNPATKGNFNVMAKLEDGTKLKLMGNIDDFSAEHQGLILGDMPDEEKATDLELTLEGRMLSGTAKTENGPIEFSFEC